MAFEQYKANVQSLCNKRGVANPIREEDLKIRAVVFRVDECVTLTVQGTDMNRAGRLFVEDVLEGNSGPPYARDLWLPCAGEFFTPELWNDCGPERRPLVYWLKGAYEIAQVVYKE